jgi:hypothetical protein
MGLVEEYIELFEISHSNISFEMDNLDKIKILYEHYDIPHESDTYSQNHLTKYFMDEIPKLLKCENDCELNLLKKIRDHLLLKHFFEGNPLKPIFVLDTILASGLRFKNLVPFTNKEIWKKIIEMAMDFNNLTGLFLKSSIQLKIDEPRIYNLGKAAKYFRKKGYEVKIVYGEVKIHEIDLKKICNEIDNYMRLLGGITVTYAILHRSNLYDDTLNRYQFNRTLGFGKYPLIPIGYLLNLAVKYPQLTMIKYSELWEYYFHYLIEISSHLGSIYNVQPYSNIQLLFMGSIFEKIREIALFDNMFTLTQLRPSDVTRILNGLFEGIVEKEMENKLGFNLSNLTNVVNRLFNLAINNDQPLIFDKSSLMSEENEFVLNKILNMLSQDINLVNKEFFCPIDQSNYIFKPVIKVKDKYVLMNKSTCAPAFFEALDSELRNNNFHNIDIGTNLENFIKSELIKNNIQCSSGHYKMDSIEGDCDVIVESDDTIVLFEVKRKSLTRASQSGDDTSLILDLSKSLLHAQLQAGKHEILLKKNGYIEFDNGNRLEFKNRTIERIALTLLDYGGFQDRHIINNILRRMSAVNFSTRISKYIPDFNELKEKTDKLKEQNQILADYDENFNKSPFFNCWFLSLPQLLIIIDDSNNTETFVKQLTKVKHIGFLSHDWYFEYGQLNKILK